VSRVMEFIFYPFYPTQLCLYMAGLMGWGLMKRFTGLFSEGIIRAKGGGWVASFTSALYEILLCLPFPYFFPYLESPDSHFVLVCIAGYLHCAIV